jgi:hypothetical protein
LAPGPGHQQHRVVNISTKILQKKSLAKEYIFLHKNLSNTAKAADMKVQVHMGGGGNCLDLILNFGFIFGHTNMKYIVKCCRSSYKFSSLV